MYDVLRIRSRFGRHAQDEEKSGFSTGLWLR